MYIEGKACWLNHSGNALEKNNNRVHGTTKITHFEMSTDQKQIATLKTCNKDKTKIKPNRFN